MIEIRGLETLEEFAGAVQLQRLIWGWDDLDVIPVRFFVVARGIGGMILGAFDRDFLAGFCLAIPGVKADGKLYLHSHMLGVLPEYRDAGAGRLLKFAQREAALARGIDWIEWTFDPLEIKNAYFNIGKLGAIVRRFEPNLYGFTSSLLGGGLPTDRCVAEWHLHREPEPVAVAARVSVPADIAAIKRTDPEAARTIQASVATQFEQHLGAGFAVTGFERSEDAGTYLFSKWPFK